MPTATKRRKKVPQPDVPEVLTLKEAAEYLRLTEDALVEAIEQQHLPARKVRQEWRFLKSAIEEWLRTPPRLGNDAIASLAGAWKDDPHLEEMLDTIYRQRGRSMLEERE